MITQALPTFCYPSPVPRLLSHQGKPQLPQATQGCLATLSTLPGRGAPRMSMPAGMPKRILTGKDRKRFMVNCSLKKKEGQFRAGKMGASDLKQAGSPCTQTIHCSEQQDVEKGR